MIRNEYVLITAARNEEGFIEATLKSVTAQTIPPLRWIIVSDGSTDRTDEIIARYEKRYNFIKLFRLENKQSRNFAAKVHAVRIGYEAVQDMDFDFVGNLDADASFEPDYYERILGEFDRNAKLGIAGGVTYDKIDGKFVEVRPEAHRVSGMIQMFRRACYEKVGGYLPLLYGGEDTAASIMALMNDWEVKTFDNIKTFHHRCRGLSGNGMWQDRSRLGKMFYHLGWSPIYMLIRIISRLPEKPYVLGGIAQLCGYWGTWLRREQRPVSDEFVNYVQREQLHKIISMLHLGK